MRIRENERDDLIWLMAEAAWKAHYCTWMGDHTKCEGHCRNQGECFELANGFNSKDYDRDDWIRSAEAALEALEKEFKLSFLPESP